MEFFRHCPGCGRRFHIKLEKKTRISEDREKIPRASYGPTAVVAPEMGVRYSILVHDERPIILDIDEFQYTYKCKHCGHEWTEHHQEEHRER